MSAFVDSKNFGNADGHYLNWYVYRDKNIKKELSRFWNKGLGIEDTETMKGASIEQRIVKAVNVLFRNMESEGPFRTECSHYQYDSKYDFCHAHVSDGILTYVVMWEFDVDERIINIVKIGKHKNFDYKRHKKHKKPETINNIKKLREEDPKYQEYLIFDKKRKEKKI